MIRFLDRYGALDIEHVEGLSNRESSSAISSAKRRLNRKWVVDELLPYLQDNDDCVPLRDAIAHFKSSQRRIMASIADARRYVMAEPGFDPDGGRTANGHIKTITFLHTHPDLVVSRLKELV